MLRDSAHEYSTPLENPRPSYKYCACWHAPLCRHWLFHHPHGHRFEQSSVCFWSPDAPRSIPNLSSDSRVHSFAVKLSFASPEIRTGSGLGCIVSTQGSNNAMPVSACCEEFAALYNPLRSHGLLSRSNQLAIKVNLLESVCNQG